MAELKVINGSLLDATTEYIVQQTCCTALRPHGLSETIAKRWSSVDPYGKRTKYKGNWATADSRPAVGSIQVYPNPDGPQVICAFAQYTHGKPGKYQDPLMIPVSDTTDDRLLNFKVCLERIAELKPKSLGFPWKIGCGLAGGNWSQYFDAIHTWASKHPETQVIFYKL